MLLKFKNFENECIWISDAEFAISKQRYTRRMSGNMGSAAASSFFLGPFVVVSLAAAAA